MTLQFSPAAMGIIRCLEKSDQIVEVADFFPQDSLVR